MKKLLVTAIVVSCFSQVDAQFTYDYLKAADNYFRKGDYFSAAEYYEKYLEGGKTKNNRDVYNPYTPQVSSKKSVAAVSSKEQAVYNLAESYRLLNYHIKAEPVYKNVVDAFNEKFPLARYHYAATLRALQKYEEAEKELSAFLNAYTAKDNYSESAAREIQNLRFIREQLNNKDIHLYTVNKATGSLNTDGANYSPVWMGNSLLFTSTRADNAAERTEVHNNRIYRAAYENGAAGNVEKLSLAQPGDMHQGVVGLTPDGNTMFLTRWTIGEGKKTATLYKSIKAGDSWSEPVMLDASVNASGYSAQQPFVMPDGKHILFSSDQPGGQGGFDLWYATIDASGNPGKPQNLGTAINTKFDEQAPFYHAASKTLVYSSNGMVGMGGYDFFYSKGNIGNWAEPKNFGNPVNSVKDDLYFTSRGGATNVLEDVLFSSDRNAECCLEMYALKKVNPAKQVSGLVVDCATDQVIMGATVAIVDTIAGTTVSSKVTGNEGTYAITLPDFRPLKATATAEGYYPSSIHFFAPSDESSLQLVNPSICLVKIPEVGTKEVLENVYYEFNKAVILDESTAALDKLVDMLNRAPTVTIEIGGHTDSKGTDEYNQKLSEARAQSVVNYLIEKGIARDRLTAVGYGETQPIAPNENADGSDNPEGREKNRRTEFKILSK